MHHGDQQVRQTPQGLTVSLLGGRRDQNAYDAGDDAVRRRAGELAVDGVARAASEPRIVGLVEDPRGDAPDRADDAVQDRPADGFFLGCGLRRDGVAETLGAHRGERPDQQHDLEDQDARDARVEKRLELVRPDPDQGKRDEAEEHVAEECRRREARGVDVVRDPFFQVRPDGFKADVHALSADPRLYRVPNQREEDAVVDDEAAAVETPDL